MQRFVSGRIRLRMPYARAGAHVLHAARLHGALVADAVLVLELAAEHEGQNLHILMRVRREARRRRDIVVVEHAQSTPIEIARIVVLSEAEREARLEPAVIGAEALAGSLNGKGACLACHGLYTIHILSIVRLPGRARGIVLLSQVKPSGKPPAVGERARSEGHQIAHPSGRLAVAASAIIMLGLCSRAAGADQSVLGDLHWRSIGPGQSGGRVAAVAGTDADSSLYYIGAADGGVFRTTNGGATWDDVWAHQPVAAIGALAIAPSAKRVIWVGTGESKPRNDASYGDGVWLSEDGGASWLHRGLENSYAISRILVSSRDPHTALAGALGDPFVDSEGRGVYRTTDGGATWQKTLYVAAHSGVADLAWDVHGERLVFAAVWQFRRVPWSFKSGGVDDGIYRSTDGGVTWSKLEGHGLPGGLMGRIGVAVAPSDPQRVYALIQSKEGVLWRSDDAGASWRLVSRDTALNQRPFYMSRLEVDPHDANHVFFLSEDLYESKDSGATFRS